jgi:hypothetical protein
MILLLAKLLKISQKKATDRYYLLNCDIECQLRTLLEVLPASAKSELIASEKC